MSIWILAIVLLLLFGGLGFAKGAIRTTISLVGILLGAALAIPLSGVIRPLMGPIGVVNPVWLTIVPPIVTFFLIYFVFIGISFFVHHRIYLLYKYKHDDVDRIRWERMNRHVGAGVGMLAGAILFLYVSGLIYAAGYLTVQLSAEENPGTVRFINSVRQDMSETGFDKAAARFQPASKLYYEGADILGLLYNNPLLQNRLAHYPYFLPLGQRSEFQEIATDKEYNDLIFGRAPVTQIIEHPRTQGILGNAEIMEYLRGTDIKDLKEYLRTGISPKYADQEVLGVWDLDKAAVLTFMRKANPDIRARELRTLRQVLEALPPVTLTVMPEGKVVVQSGAAAAAAPAEQQPAADSMEAQMAARYGADYLQRSRGGAPQAPAAAPAATPPPNLIPQFSGEGSWTEEGGGYSITLSDAGGRQVTGTAKVRADELVLTIAGANLVFYKQ
jgi:uncharacterized membrane protein required for colicin V production